MRIALVTPARPGARSGNRHTALRWAAFLRAAGHRVDVRTEWNGEAADAMLALHARRSHASIRAFPGPVILALTGTDVYHDIHHSSQARESLELADRLIVLQPKAAEEFSTRKKVHVVVQSSATRMRHQPIRNNFRICVIGHLRAVKDPLLTLRALQHVSQEIEVVQLGELLEPALKPKTGDARYRWLGSVPHGRALRWLASSHAMVISSRMEGGANVVAEAVTSGTPVVASDCDGNIGMLGANYPGYFRVGDSAALAALLVRCRDEPRFLERLVRLCAARARLFRPQAERRALKAALAAARP